MDRTTLLRVLAVFVIVAGLAGPVAAQVCGPQLDGRLANAYYAGSTIFWDPVVSYDRMVLTISGPCEEIVRVYDSKDQMMFDIRDVKRIVDGQYTWELRRVAKVDKGVQQNLTGSRGSGQEQELWWSYFQNGKLPEGPFVESGSFRVVEGQVIDPASGNEKAAEGDSLFSGLASAGVGTGASGTAQEGDGFQTKVVLTGADGVIRNSLCVGFDCVNSPAFGDSTIILEENNTRIKFSDTSVNAFPSGDWEIEANSNVNGGLSYLAFNDCGANDLQGSCADDPVFGVEAGARRNALWVESDGDVGIGTQNPVTEIHAVRGDTPTLRLEQDGSSGFAPQAWDVAGNETSFFIRDATNGSTLPFRIRPGAASQSLVIDSDSDVGVGVLSAEEKLHVRGTDGTTKLLVEEANGTTDGRQIMELRNNGNVNFILVNSNAGGDDWQILAETGGANPGFSLSLQGSGVREFRIAPNGDVIAGGAVVHASSRTLKENFVDLDPREVLTRVTELPITQWNYTKDGETLRHVGPMAEDFHSAFGLGSSDRYIAISDSVGVTMAAVQGLNQALEASDEEKDRQIAELRDSNTELQTRVDELETLVRQIAAER